MAPRIATHDDIPDLVRIINAAYRVETFFIRGERTSADEVAALIDAPGAAFLVFDGDDGGAMAGTVYVDTHGTRGHFALLAVDPKHQGKGLGRKLVAAVEAYCRAAGCTVVELEVFNVREELPPFYGSCGFVAAGVTDFARADLLLQPAHLICMRKPVPVG